LISSISDITKDSAKVIHGKFFGLSGSAESKSIIVKLIDAHGETSALSEVPYDAIIICTGVPYTAPIRNSAVLGPTLENRLLEVDDYNKRLRSASRVIISGGGLVGVELAAEVSVRLEKQVKEVLLISRSTLLGTLPEEAGRLALNWLKKRKNVKVFLNDEIVGAPFQDGSNSSPSSSSVGRGDNIFKLHSSFIKSSYSLLLPSTTLYFMADLCENFYAGDEPGTTMTYRTLKGELLKGDMFIDCTGQYAKASVPTANDYKIATSSSVNIDSAVSKEFVWPYNSNGLIAVDAHLMVSLESRS
jgi:Pyridine nucleotide-disulphide oxidoreductase